MYVPNIQIKTAYNTTAYSKDKLYLNIEGLFTAFPKIFLLQLLCYYPTLIYN